MSRKAPGGTVEMIEVGVSMREPLCEAAGVAKPGQPEADLVEGGETLAGQLDARRCHAAVPPAWVPWPRP